MYTPTPLICLYGVDRDNFTFTLQTSDSNLMVIAADGNGAAPDDDDDKFQTA